MSTQLEYLYAAEHESFARLTQPAIDVLLELSPLVDVGAGNGWWAKRLTELGADVIAIEPNNPAHQCFPLVKADHRAIVNYGDRTLLMVWPTRHSEWATECAFLYQGDTVVYVGDPLYLWTASHTLPYVLRQKGFQRIRTISINSWPHHPIIDTLSVWKRVAE